MDKPTFLFGDDHKGSEITSILNSFPAQNLSHPKQYPENVADNWKCLCFSSPSLTMHYHFTALRNETGKLIPRYNLQNKNPQML